MIAIADPSAVLPAPQLTPDFGPLAVFAVAAAQAGLNGGGGVADAWRAEAVACRDVTFASKASIFPGASLILIRSCGDGYQSDKQTSPDQGSE